LFSEVSLWHTSKVTGQNKNIKNQKERSLLSLLLCSRKEKEQPEQTIYFTVLRVEKKPFGFDLNSEAKKR